ncbi:hypothetical protein [Dactylosporangium sp. NPDC005555]|uniref:hypothetical protein n=1 Tax=Dactylosporangium sp. NPDC005555 TaxID=3154889 RepID=UPI0033BD4651
MRFGPRYAAALAVDAIGAGLLRPFLVVYGLSVLNLPTAATGLALSAGLLAGLLAVPLTLPDQEDEVTRTSSTRSRGMPWVSWR